MSDPSTAGSLYLLDAHGLIFQMYYAIGRMSAPDGRPTNAVYGVTRSLMNMYDRGADYLIATLDHKDPTFRSSIDENYKAHRDPPPDDLLTQEPMIQQIMDAMRVPFLVVPGYEADDIMATVAVQAAARGLDVFLCTADKDCRQLVTPKVKILNLRKPEGELLDAAGIEADWGVRPDQVVDFQSLVGDAVDNIPGVPGVGPKTAAKWLQQFGTLDNLIAHTDEAAGGPKTRQALKDAIANGSLAKSRSLVKLTAEVPLKLDWEGWKRKDWDGQRLLELFHEYGFRSFADRVRSTLTTSGAQKNAAALETAGLARRPLAPSSTDSLEPTTKAKRMKPSAGGAKARGLFDAINEVEPSDSNSPDSTTGAEAKPPAPDDSWSYAGYQLVDTPAKFQKFLAQLKNANRFVFDLETMGLDPISDAIVGFAFCWEPTVAYYLPVRGPNGEAILDPAETLAALQPIFENPTVAKVNHNIKFDQMVLASNGVTLAGIAGDSMIAHYLLVPAARTHGLDDLTLDLLGHRNISITELIGKGKKQTTMDTVSTARVKDYAAEDADAAWQLIEKLEPELSARGFRALYDDLEVPLIPVLAEMELTGISVNVPFLEKLSAEMAVELAGLEKEIHTLAGRAFKISSLRELQKVLFDELRLPVQKRTGVKNEPSTDSESLERLAALGHALPKKLIQYRQVTKLKGTYVDVLPTLVNRKTGRIHSSFNQTGAETGRLSSSDPNMQNIPARTEQGAQLRKAFVPRAGWTLVTADYSQIELRLLAQFSEDEAMRRAFAEDRDIHTAVAAQVFKVPESEVTRTQRSAAKTVNFGVIYGMSASGLSTQLSIPRKEAEEFIDAYFARYPTVLNYQQRLLQEVHRTGEGKTILGRKRRFDPTAINPNSSYRARGNAEREAINMEIQGSAADLMKRAMLAVHARLRAQKLHAKMLLTVHDELVFEAPPQEVAAVATLAREEMTGAIQLDVPLKVDVAAGPNWLEVEDV